LGVVGKKREIKYLAILDEYMKVGPMVKLMKHDFWQRVRFLDSCTTVI